MNLKRNKFLHLLPGRMRIKVPNLKRNAPLADALYAKLRKIPGVSKTTVNIFTGSVLIHYNEHLVPDYILILAVEETRHSALLQPAMVPNLRRKWPATHVLITGAALLIIYLKVIFRGRSKANQAQWLVDLAVFLSILSGYPVFSNNFQRLRLPPGIDFNILSNIVSLFFLILKDSFEGLFITLMVAFSELVGTVNLEKVNQEIRQYYRYPRRIRMLTGEREVLRPASALTRKSILVIKSGELILADGKVVGGRAEVDESRITGQPEYQIKEVDSKVFAGSWVVKGKFYVQVEKLGANTFQGQLRKHFKAKREQVKETIFQLRIRRLSLFTFFLAGIVYLITRNKVRAVTILLAGIPSAAGMALPAVTGSALGSAAKKKIFIKDEKIFPIAANLDLIAFDKNGTLTGDEVKIEEIMVLGKVYGQADILRAAVKAKGNLRPGLARAIWNKAKEMHQVEMMERAQEVLIGDQSFMAAHHIPCRQFPQKAARLRHLGLIPVFVAMDGKIQGILGVAEKLKPKARETIEQLRGLGIRKIVLLTGDSQAAAEHCGEQTGIAEIYSGLSAQEKADLIRMWKQQGYSVAMVGDGLDDAPAMAQADLGICLGSTGINSSVQGAEIVIAGEPALLVSAFRLIQKTVTLGEENQNIAQALNVLGLGLGAAGLISPVGAGVISNVGIIVVLLRTLAV